MESYDVIVVGAGPAGSTAAKVAVEMGCSVIMLDKRREVGVPQHCGGAFYPQGIEPARFLEYVRGLDASVKLLEYSKIRVYAPGGEVVKEESVAGTGYCMVRRDYLDRELARKAVNAGADLRCNTRATGLIKKDGGVVGVTTSSAAMPEVYGKVVIGADGLWAIGGGTAKWAGMTKPGQRFIAGVEFDLTRVEDIEPDVKEVHYGAFSEIGISWINPYDDKSCTTPFMSMAEFERVKKGDYPISRKLRNAVPLRITGWSHAADLGVRLPRVIDDGLILTGSAAGWVGTWMCIVSGEYAGTAAALAVNEGDVTVKKLGKYEELCTELTKASYPFPLAFEGMSDEAIEKELSKTQPFKTT